MAEVISICITYNLSTKLEQCLRIGSQKYLENLIHLLQLIDREYGLKTNYKNSKLRFGNWAMLSPSNCGVNENFLYIGVDVTVQRPTNKNWLYRNTEQ